MKMNTEVKYIVKTIVCGFGHLSSYTMKAICTNEANDNFYESGLAEISGNFENNLKEETDDIT